MSFCRATCHLDSQFAEIDMRMCNPASDTDFSRSRALLSGENNSSRVGERERERRVGRFSETASRGNSFRSLESPSGHRGGDRWSGGAQRRASFARWDRHMRQSAEADSSSVPFEIWVRLRNERACVYARRCLAPRCVTPRDRRSLISTKRLRLLGSNELDSSRPASKRNQR